VRLKREMNASSWRTITRIRKFQDLADFVGDSLNSPSGGGHFAGVIVLRRRAFHGRTAKILNPTNRSCSGPEGRLLARRRLPGRFVREVSRALSDHLVISYIIARWGQALTTSSAHRAMRRKSSARSREQPILFAPDQHLGRYLMKKHSRNLRLWQGSCIVTDVSERSLVQLKERHPEAVFWLIPSAPKLSCASRITWAQRLDPELRENEPAAEFIVAD